jgi:hypothetical protein
MVFSKINIRREVSVKIFRLQQKRTLNNYIIEFFNLNVIIK